MLYSALIGQWSVSSIGGLLPYYNRLWHPSKKDLLPLVLDITYNINFGPMGEIVLCEQDVWWLIEEALLTIDLNLNIK